MWNGPFTLRDMMVEIPSCLEHQFSDYKMNLLQISESGEYCFHHGEVEIAFGMIRELLAGNLEQVESEYGEAPITYGVRSFIGAVTKVPEFMKEEKKEKGERSMCKVIDDLRIEMMERGELRNIISLIRRKSQKGLDVEQIGEHLELEESYVEQVIEVIEEHPDSSDLEIVDLLQGVEV